MQIFHEIEPGLLKQSAVAVGFFDGVHPGHQVVIKKALQEAQKFNATPCVVTFKDHPRTLTAGISPPLLTTLDQRLSLFEDLGIKATLLLEVREDICSLTAPQYVEQVLISGLNAKSVSIGYNHHFGKNREGNPQILQVLGNKLGFIVNVAEGLLIDGFEVSSSRIREALLKGNIEEANKLLGRPYEISGTVIRGDGRGRQIGFPTANLQVTKEQLLPGLGVYAGIATLADKTRHACVCNVGKRPTVKNDAPVNVEIHIHDFNQDIYNQKLSLEFLHFIRPETKFASVDALKDQIAKDCQSSRQLLCTSFS